MDVWTIGHSTRTYDTFVQILQKHGIQAIVDVRRFPTSKRMPWYKKEFLEMMLPKAGIKYSWLGDKLGGYRKGGYANHARSKDFLLGMHTLMNKALVEKTSIMCAEAEHTRCHRAHIADYLAEEGWNVHHIFDDKNVQRHERQEVL